MPGRIMVPKAKRHYTAITGKQGIMMINSLRRPSVEPPTQASVGRGPGVSVVGTHWHVGLHRCEIRFECADLVELVRFAAPHTVGVTPIAIR